jgi:hypothetical protein
MPFMDSDPAELAEGQLPECLTLWRCIGCGAMGNAEQCTGACAYQKLYVVSAEEHAELLENFAAIKRQEQCLEAVVQDIAALTEERSHPESAYRDLQTSARTLFRSLDHEALSSQNLSVPDDERAIVWSCATCGQVEAPQPCLGICIRRNGDFLRASDHDELAARAEVAQVRARELAALVRQFVWVAPHAGQWDAARRAFQEKAIKLLIPAPPARDGATDISPAVT